MHKQGRRTAENGKEYEIIAKKTLSENFATVLSRASARGRSQLKHQNSSWEFMFAMPGKKFGCIVALHVGHSKSFQQKFSHDRLRIGRNLVCK